MGAEEPPIDELMAKQSATDRLFRLSEGRCPIHGLDMTQVEPGGIVGCPRKDCSIRAVMDFEIDEEEFRVLSCTLLSEWQFIIDGGEVSQLSIEELIGN